MQNYGFRKIESFEMLEANCSIKCMDLNRKAIFSTLLLMKMEFGQFLDSKVPNQLLCFWLVFDQSNWIKRPFLYNVRFWVWVEFLLSWFINFGICVNIFFYWKKNDTSQLTCMKISKNNKGDCTVSGLLFSISRT